MGSTAKDKKAPAPAPAADTADPNASALAELGITPDLIAQLKSGGGTSSNFIGLPASGPESTGANVDLAPGAASTGTKALPRYTQGAEWLPVRQGMTPIQLQTLQDKMVDGGLLDGPFSYGGWDAKSQQAFSQVLATANNSGTDWETALSGIINTGTTSTVDPKTGKIVALTPGQKKLKSVSLEYTNSDDLATVANNTAQQKLGRYFTQDELNRFVNSFHGQEETEAQDKQAGLPATAPSSPDVAAQTFAEQADPVAAKARNGLAMIQQINSALSGMGLGGAEPK